MEWINRYERYGVSETWETDRDADAVRQSVEEFLTAGKMQVVSTDKARIEALGGSSFRTRMLGAWLVKRTTLPTKAVISIEETASGTSVAATVEYWADGDVTLDPIGRNVADDHLAQWLIDLRKAVGA